MEDSNFSAMKTKLSHFNVDIRRSKINFFVKKHRAEQNDLNSTKNEKPKENELEECFEMLTKFNSKQEFSNQLLFLYFNLSVIKQYLQNVDSCDLSTVISKMRTSGKCSILFETLVWLKKMIISTTKENKIDLITHPIGIALSEGLWIFVAIFAGKEEDVREIATEEVISYFLDILDFSLDPLDFIVFFALRNAAQNNYSLVNSFTNSKIFDRISAAMKTVEEKNPEGFETLLGMLIALFASLLEIEVKPDKPLVDYAIFITSCYDQKYDICKNEEEIILSFLYSFSSDASFEEISKFINAPCFLGFMNRLTDTFLGNGTNNICCIRIITNLSGVKEDEVCLSIPADVLSFFLKYGLLSTDEDVSTEALLTMKNVLLVEKDLFSELLEIDNLMPIFFQTMENSRGNNFKECLKNLALILQRTQSVKIRETFYSEPEIIDVLLNKLTKSLEPRTYNNVLKTACDLIDNDDFNTEYKEILIKRVFENSVLVSKIMKASESGLSEARRYSEYLLDIIEAKHKELYSE